MSDKWPSPSDWVFYIEYDGLPSDDILWGRPEEITESLFGFIKLLGCKPTSISITHLLDVINSAQTDRKKKYILIQQPQRILWH